MNVSGARRPITNHYDMATGDDARRKRQPFGDPTRTPRLTLSSPAESDPREVDGVWWPWTGNLTAEVHDLIAALTYRLGPTAWIRFDWNQLSLDQRRVDASDDVHVTGPASDQPADVMELAGTNGQRMSLLVLSHDTPADVANAAMRRVVVGGAAAPEPSR
ncbi:DUF5994 family protein [Nocardia bovistercoris]|uniref:Uncharacterized protein n=1 Tax=Nocardia bovistercoris TaxID=2785916 RepID=A0A931IC44_9NOCA|nr:DUF5994 family protein [Nocardia bovistercoris]MBH0777793.1 hypothetical protein [Nocardia bovistercoris]